MATPVIAKMAASAVRIAKSICGPAGQRAKLEPERQWPAGFGVEPRRQNAEDGDDAENAKAETGLDQRVAPQMAERAPGSAAGAPTDARQPDAASCAAN